LARFIGVRGIQPRRLSLWLCGRWRWTPSKSELDNMMHNVDLGFDVGATYRIARTTT
jgi:hypothetical protein